MGNESKTGLESTPAAIETTGGLDMHFVAGRLPSRAYDVMMRRAWASVGMERPGSVVLQGSVEIITGADLA